MKKAIHKPTNQNTIILSESDDYCEILLDGEYVNVSKDDLEFFEPEAKVSSLDDFEIIVFESPRKLN